MVIKLPPGLPAAETLRKEGIAVADDDSILPRQTLRIVLLNLMPRKEATELAFARLLAQSGHDIELTLAVHSNYQPRNVSAEHMERFYCRWPEIRNKTFDALIVTGAPVETLPFEEVTYWDEICEIVGWAKTNVGAALYVCWAAQAALYAMRGIQKQALADKAFGIFEQSVMAHGSPLVRGMGTSFPVPVSRHTAVSEQALVAAGLLPVARSADTGACIVDDEENRAVYIFDHLEYDDDTLELEYQRDRQSGRPVSPPYTARPGWSWRPYAALFFRNWLDRARAHKDEPDPALDWLFQEGAQERRAGTKLVLQASSRPHLLAEALRCLDHAGVSACYANIGQHEARTSVVVVELDDSAASSADRAAAALVRLPGARRVLYRVFGGSGGVLRPVQDRTNLTWAA
jgi:homoserine O-succinyltransferase/O-acetyltransferase